MSKVGAAKGFYLSAVALGFAVVAAIAAAYFAPSYNATFSAALINQDSGFAYVAADGLKPAWPYTIESPKVGDPAVSTLRLFENGRPLGPGSAVTDDIRAKGAGMFSHWNGAVWFSASDNSDPRANGRTYAVSARAALPRWIWWSLALGALAFGVAYRRSLVLYAARAAQTILAGVAAGGVVIALASRGAVEWGRLGVTAPGFAAAVLGHALLGVALAWLVWMLGVAAGNLAFRRAAASPSAVSLIGYPLGMLLSAGLAAAALLGPFGLVASVAVAGALLVVTLRDEGGRSELKRGGKTLLAAAPFAVLFGLWMGALWRGPTVDVSGVPSGDLLHYGVLVSTLQRWPAFVLPDLGDVGGKTAPLGALFSAYGAAVGKWAPVDPMVFIPAAAASFFIASLGLSIGAYSRARSTGTAELLLMAAAIIACMRYPYWVVESPAVVFMVSLTLAIWITSTEKPSNAPVAGAAALGGSVLSKVASLPSLGALALVGAPTYIANASVRVKALMALLGASIAGYVLFMVAVYLPGYLSTAPIGPDTWVLGKAGMPGADLWPYVLRDIGSLLLVALAWRVARWPVALAVSTGVAMAFAYPWVFRINLLCCGLILALAASEGGARASLRSWIFAAFALCVPAAFITELGGWKTDLVWILCVLGGVLAVTGRQESRARRGGRVLSPALCALAVLSLCVALGRGSLVLDGAGWSSAQVLTPEMRQIWMAAKARVPADALIFTDQTGPVPTVMEGWNSLPDLAQRQVYLSNWVQSARLRWDEKARAEKLAANEAVLTGRMKPADAPDAAEYKKFYAVTKTPPANGKLTFATRSYGLYELTAHP